MQHIQTIERDFITLHIYHLQTNLVETCFQHGIFDHDSICNRERCEREQREIREWWLVSDWLAERLRTAGEPVLAHPFGVWWGRTVTGQRIAMDDIICEIAAPYLHHLAERKEAA